MMSRSSPPPPPAAPIATDQVLVATRDLPYGAALSDGDTAWIEWPKASLPNGAMSKSKAPNAKQDVKSSFVRVPISSGEPLRRERLITSPTAKLMSATLSPGRRAVAIDIAPQGANAAGGFILPNDHVDVVRTFRNPERGVEVPGSETIATNVRVLAMGQTVEMKNGETAVTGVTATLELDQHQTELVILGQRTGQLALALRAMADWNSNDESAQPVALSAGPLSKAFGVLHGRLTIPRDSGNVQNPGSASQAGLHQSHDMPVNSVARPGVWRNRNCDNGASALATPATEEKGRAIVLLGSERFDHIPFSNCKGWVGLHHCSRQNE